MKNLAQTKNIYFTTVLADLVKELVYCICPICKSNKVIPVIFGLIERKQHIRDKNGKWDFYDEDKIIGCLEENDLIYNPGCVPDSFMNERNETPNKYCKECESLFDFKP